LASDLKRLQQQKTNMKMQSKPTIALVAGAVLLFGALSPSARAQGLIASNTVDITDPGNVAANDLSVQYEVFDNSGVFTYDYVVANPSTSTKYLGDFEVYVNTHIAGSAFNVSTTSSDPGDFQTATGSGVDWFFGSPIAPGSKTATLSYQSDYTYFLGTANASGTDNWASSNPGGELVATANAPVIPEPSTTALFGAALLLVAIRPTIFKRA
jgi:hypothetical protein